ncbi:YciI family protein [Curtobacterium flaccumfaciens pv. flaccumfaciens]|uniref:YciI family protein n=1 Tax=Curtobacterium flaccumfaciens TaxID=2035 RepID=UPI00217E85B6|nr:YciI family protein [Curtobacterium flaccumfaciens]MCS6556268.1 YciI family protein [Curtobacterium flaccumfaciens]QYI96801.1 YciI family protein [Curtobacterium flaccumfaciens pv. flaccumfaciens]
MQFLVNVIDDGQAAAVGNTYSATDAEAAAVDAFNQRMADAIVFAAGVSAPADATVVDAREGAAAKTADTTTRPATTGPATSTDEYVAGFWVMDLPDAATAARVAHQASQACNRKIELRPLL